MIKSLINQLKFEYLKNRRIFQPVFLIGCGRSGTTVLGATLGKHKSITYLNERRDLWHEAYPNFDIWSGKTTTPQLIAKKKDNKKDRTKLLRKLFFREQILNNSDILLEKLPINNFRLEFIESAFPNAKYIYLHRNGVEVAKSMEKIAIEKGWFGVNPIKWQLIKGFLSTSNISERDFSIFEKGLLEWRYSLKFSEVFFSKINKERYYSLSYQDLLENPALQIANIYNFLNLDFSNQFISETTAGIKRRSKKITDLTAEHIELGGQYLKRSINNELGQAAITNYK